MQRQSTKPNPTPGNTLNREPPGHSLSLTTRQSFQENGGNQSSDDQKSRLDYQIELPRKHNKPTNAENKYSQLYSGQP